MPHVFQSPSMLKKYSYALCRSAFTDPLRGYATALTWKDTSTLHELSKTKTTVFLDPNYLLPEETALEPWSIVLRAHYRAHGDDAVLVDIHGMGEGIVTTVQIHSHPHPHACTRTRTHACTHARARAHTHTHTQTHNTIFCYKFGIYLHAMYPSSSSMKLGSPDRHGILQFYLQIE